MQKSPEIFSFRDYKKYLKQWLKVSGAERFGVKSRMATALRCQAAYLSHVLRGKAHLSPDQALAASEFMGHDGLETKYFLALVHYARAGTPRLRSHIELDLKALEEEQLNLEKKIHSQVISEEETLNRFYSAWHYTALHVALGIENFNTTPALAQAFGLPEPLVQEALDFMCQSGLAEQTKSRTYRSTTRFTHLPKNSPRTLLHHSNWRMKALADAALGSKESLHYSSVISIHDRDEATIRKILNQAIEDIRQCVSSSEGENSVYSYDLDFFKVNRA